MAWSSTLAVSIDENAETILLTSPFFPRRSSNVVYIEGEAVEVTGAGGTVINVLRGMLGTDPVPHAQGAVVGRYDPIVVMNTTAGTAPGTAVAGPHVHVEYADAAHAHGTAAHLHDYATTGHAHGTAAHTHNYSDPAHNHDAAYSASGHAHGTVAHPHDYAATGHSHGTASHGHAQADVTSLTADLASKAGTAHNHDAAYAATGHTHGAGGFQFPVDAIYITLDATNPATVFGYGTWSLWGTGRVLLSAADGQANQQSGSATHSHSFTQGTASLESAHTHTYTQVVNHVHVQTVNSATTGGLSGYAPDTSSNTPAVSGYSTQNPTGGVATGTTAGGSAHTHTLSSGAVADGTNQPPSISAYFWRRTA